MVSVASSELTDHRRVFPAWSIDVPVSFSETFIQEDGYWHAYDEHRSISLTSMTVGGDLGPANADELVKELRAADAFESHDLLDELPQGLLGWATVVPAPSSSRASRLLQGVVVTDGRLLLATITSDDLDWAQRIWRSIRWYPALMRPDAEPPGGPSRVRQRARRRA